MNKRNRILLNIKSNYWYTTHKYGTQVPNSIVETKQKYEYNNSMWCMDAVKLEIYNIMVESDYYEGGVSDLCQI